MTSCIHKYTHIELCARAGAIHPRDIRSFVITHEVYIYIY